MKRCAVIMILLAIFLQAYTQQKKTVRIIHTNDLHSRLTGFAPESLYTPLTVNDDNTRGGFARLACIIRHESSDNECVTFVVDAGDFFMGTLYPGLERSTGFQLRLMQKMGYDVVGIGNHEYEFGPEWLGSVIARSSALGHIPVLLSGNARFKQGDPGDTALIRLSSEKLISDKVIITRGGVKAGFFSILGKDAVEVAPNATPVTFEKQVHFAKRIVKELKNEKCDIIVCISHSGIKKMKDGSWGGEDVELASKVKGIDIIIGGHSHTKLDKPVVVNGIPIVQTGEFGQYAGVVDMLAGSGKAELSRYKLLAVNDSIQGEKDIYDLIESQKAAINDRILNQLGLSYSEKVVATDFTLEGNDTGDFLNSNLGPFIADAIRYYVNKNNEQGTDIAMVAAGMIFDKIVPGIQTVPDIFRVMPLGSGSDSIPGYALSRLYITSKELKKVLEILYMAGKSDPQNYCYYSGIKVGYNPADGLFRKITRIDLIKADGSTVNVDFKSKSNKLISVTADSYMLSFIGIIKKMSHGLINVVPKDISGSKIKDMKTAVIDINSELPGIQEGKEWLALIEYLHTMTDTNGDGIPDMDNKYRKAAVTNKLIAR